MFDCAVALVGEVDGEEMWTDDDVEGGDGQVRVVVG